MKSKVSVIAQSELSFHPHSFADPDGRLFSWNGGLYRAISREKTAFFKQLFERGIIQKLVERRLLVGTELSDIEAEGYGMVLRHHRVPFVSYPHEWCPEMFKDAALAYLELRGELLAYDLTLRDTHPWNLLFDGPRPVYVDVTSIRATAPGSGLDYAKFCRYYLHPLTLICRGYGRIVRNLLPEYEGILPSDYSALMRQSSASLLPILKRVARKLRGVSRNELRFLQDLAREIRQIRLPAASVRQPKPAEDFWAPLERALKPKIDELRPDSILAIGVKTQWPATLAAQFGSPVVSFDTDGNYISALYRDARDKDLNLLPLMMDFTDPTPSRGLPSHVSISAADRLRCDLVLALGLVRDVVIGKHLRFEQVVTGLSSLCKRWLIVDLSPDPSTVPGREYAGYSTENFVKALSSQFPTVRPLPCGGTNDGLFFCGK